MCPGAPRLVHSGPETPPLPGLPPPPPPPPTWLQPSAQASPAGGREGAGRAERESVDVSCTVQRVTRVVPSRYESVCHPDPTVSSSTPSAEKGITCQTACKNHSLRTKTQKCLRKTTQRDADSDLITGNCSILERNERICAETAKVRLQ